MKSSVEKRLGELEKRVKELEGRPPYATWWGVLPPYPYWYTYPQPYVLCTSSTLTASTNVTTTATNALPLNITDT